MRDVRAVIAAVQGMSAPRIDRGRRPTIDGISVVIKSWRRLPSPYRLATAKAATVVVVIEIGLAVSSLGRVARFMGVPLATDRTAPPLAAQADLEVLDDRERQAYWAVRWVLTRWLFDGTCLRRALAFGWFIRRHHPVLRLGMSDEEGTIAHAWIEAEGHAFDASSVVAGFVARTPISSDFDPPAAGLIVPEAETHMAPTTSRLP